MQSKTTGSVLFPILFGFSAIAGLIVCVGLACSNVFSILFSFALGVMPTRQNEVSALMIMGVSGGALLTPVMGLVADQFGQVAAFGLLGAWPDWWTDGFGSGAREAAVSRVTHSDIIANQAGLAFAQLLGAELPKETQAKIDAANKALLFYDEHTFGYSESVRDAYGLETWEQRSLKQSYAWEASRHVGRLGETTMGLLQSFTPKADCPSIVVYNTLNWTYSGLAKAYIDHQILPRNKAFEIVDAQGNPVPTQPGEVRSDGTYWNIL